MTRRTRTLLSVAIAAVVLFVGGPFVYINFVKDDAPARLSVSPDDSSPGSSDATTGDASSSSVPGADTDGVSGTWKTGTDSVVGYRVKEVIFGQSTEGVGRTSDVAGSVTVDGTEVTAAEFTVQMATLASDSGRRDGQFNGRIMDTANFPVATFVLTSPIALPAGATDGSAFTAQATGELTLRGTKKQVTFPLTARLDGTNAEISGAITIVFAEWSIPNPSFGGISTDDKGELEFLLRLSR